MKHLKQFIEDENRWNELSKKPIMTLPLNQDEINSIADSIDCRMSPENLHCDGEISGAEANRKATYLHRTFAELKAHASSQGLAITVKTYEID